MAFAGWPTRASGKHASLRALAADASRPVTELRVSGTVTLYRPAGPEELALFRASGCTAGIAVLAPQVFFADNDFFAFRFTPFIELSAYVQGPSLALHWSLGGGVAWAGRHEPQQILIGVDFLAMVYLLTLLKIRFPDPRSVKASTSDTAKSEEIGA